MAEFWNLFFAYIWVWIPITAILVGGFTEWLKFRSEQRALGTSAKELEGTVHVLEERLQAAEAERSVLEHRLQNLETIVTSQAWDLLSDGVHAEEASPSAERALLDDPSPRLGATDAEKAARLARRLSV